jgi:hypothetical protein
MFAVRKLSVADGSFERVIDNRRPETASGPKPPGFDITTLLSVAVEKLDRVEALELVGRFHRAQAMLDAARLRLLERLRVLSADDASARHLVADAEKASLAKTSSDLALARTLMTRLPQTLAAMEAGLLSRDRVTQIARATIVLSQAHCHEVDAELFPLACQKTPSQLAYFLRTLIAKVDPLGAAGRDAARRMSRGAGAGKVLGGSAWLRGLMSADDAAAVNQRLDAIAYELHRGGDRRPLSRVRVDVVRGLLLGVLPGLGGTQVSVAVNTTAVPPPPPSERASGRDDDPGPIRRRGVHGARRSGRLPWSIGMVARAGQWRRGTGGVGN